MARRLRLPPVAGHIAGVDEAGCGPLAGPLVVAAVVLDPAREIRGLADSKVLTHERRCVLAARIVERAIAYAIVVVEIEEIERVNIFHARMNGMRRTLERIAGCVAIAEARIDGNHLPPGLTWPARAIIDGDALDRAIGAASILAKVERDRLMVELDAAHPGYGFASHKGYSTPEHFAALDRLGPCPIHRRGFEPVRRLLQPGFAFEPTPPEPIVDSIVEDALASAAPPEREPEPA
ncbi:MAG TPA: ribonuclease HII [Candidatus Saccharimonadia bacterium]|nr:ribonuclease HII [Candidatus Saccharimonadia bacterium]